MLIPSARAFDLTITNLNGVTIVQGGLHTFFLEVSIPANERVPAENLQLTITGPTSVSASFNPLLTSVTKSPQITELVLVDGVNSGFGYGYGYGVGGRPAAFHGYGYNFGYGHGFGFGYGYGFAPRLKYRVTINTATLGIGSYSAKLRWNTGESAQAFFESDTVTFAVIAELGVVPAPTPTPTPTPKPTPIPEVKVSTGVVIDELQKSVLDSRAKAIFGEDVVVTGKTTNITATAAGELTTQLEVTGIKAGEAVTGNLNVTVGNLAITSTNGVGTAVLELGGGISVQAAAKVTAVDNGLKVTLEQPVLKIQPPAPDTTKLTGGSAEVTKVAVDLSVGLKNLPDGASVKVEVAKDPSAFVNQAGTVFQSAAQQAGGTVGNLSEDVAFVVKVTKTGITNADLGDNKAQMQVSKAWYDARLAQKKEIVITKVGDDGKVFTRKAVCTRAGAVVDCAVFFTGAGGGLSVFALMAVAQAPTPTPTAMPSPTPIVTAVATPRPPRTGDLDTGLAASGALLAGLALLTAGALLLLRRRPPAVD